MKNIIKREIYVAMHGQSSDFRLKKYIIIALIAFVIYFLFDLVMLGKVLLVALAFSIVVHLFFRYKTSGWTKHWGAFTPFKTPYDA